MQPERMICTGYEGSGTCEWCGGTLPKRKRKFCSTDHQEEYYCHFLWHYAAPWAIRRAYWRCQSCGVSSPDYGWHWDSKRKVDYNNYEGVVITEYADTHTFRTSREIVSSIGIPYIHRRDYVLEVHHIEPVRGNRATRNILNGPWNLRVLCHVCHIAVHREMRFVPISELPLFKYLENKEERNDIVTV